MKDLTPYSAGYKDINVSVIDYNKNIAEHAWNCYKMTWIELQDVEYNPYDERVRKAIQNIIEFKALPMPREQALMTFRIDNVSRVCLAQITRQRKAAFNVESQMPQAVKHNVIIPLNIWQDESLRKEAIKLCEASQNFYDKLVDMGIPFQDARYMLLHGQTTSFVYVVDINTFCGSFGMRCENNLSDEINLVYRLCLQKMREKIDEDYYEGDGIDDLTYQFYKKILDGCDCMGAKQKKGMNTDVVFGNSFKRFDDANDDVTKATENCTCDFKKSAWYAELIRMYNNEPELLLPGEKEMIKQWKAGTNNEA